MIELNRSRNNVVLSRRAVLEDERKDQRQQILDRLNPGDVVEGTISNIVDFGAFVDLNGMDGLIHISELSWSHVNHPSEVLEIGQEVKVKVLDIDRDRQRISLGLKQTQSDPWQQVLESYSENDVVEGRVTKVVTFGAFVEILPGVEGLVHISELAQHHVENPREVVSQGDAVNVLILEVDAERRRLSLSLKRVEEGVEPLPRADGGESVHLTPNLNLSEDVFPAGAAALDEAPPLRGRRRRRAARGRRDSGAPSPRPSLSPRPSAEVEAEPEAEAAAEPEAEPLEPEPEAEAAAEPEPEDAAADAEPEAAAEAGARSRARRAEADAAAEVEPKPSRPPTPTRRPATSPSPTRPPRPCRGRSRSRSPAASAPGRARPCTRSSAHGAATVSSDEIVHHLLRTDDEVRSGDRGASWGRACSATTARSTARAWQTSSSPTGRSSTSSSSCCTRASSREYLTWREQLGELPEPPAVSRHRGAAPLRDGRRQAFRQGRRDHRAGEAARAEAPRPARRPREPAAARQGEGAARRLTPTSTPGRWRSSTPGSSR